MASAVARTRWWHLRSMQLHTIVAVCLVAAAPVAWVSAGGLMDRASRIALRNDVEQAAVELVSPPGRPAITGSAFTTETPEALAERRGVRLRGWDADGRLVVDVDHRVWSLLEAIEHSFAADIATPTLEAYDAELPPPTERPLVAEATGVPVAECRTNRDLTLVVCEAAVRAHGRTWLVQRSSRRALLYDLRFRVLRVAVWVGLFALGLGTWLSLRWVRPIAQLRDAALDRVARPLAAPPVGLRREDELGELAHAFDELLAAVRGHAAANEAFVADLAHEMKNPVAAIRSAAEALDTGEPIDAERAKRLARILDASSARLHRLVADLLDLARAENGLPGDVREPVELADLVRRAAEVVAGDPALLELDLVPLRTVGVAERLESLVRNLVANALDFRGEAPVRVAVRPEGQVAVIEVADRGPGIPPEALPHVFDRFFTTRARGTGVGLALVKAVAEAHGGSVSASPREGGGTRFEVRLPL